MSNIDRRKLMIGGAVGAASMSVAIPALAEETPKEDDAAK